MKKLSGRATSYFNLLEGRCGTLWGGRYKSSPVQSDAYLLACTRYIELNPVRAGITNNPAGYAWSSYIERTNICKINFYNYDNEDKIELNKIIKSEAENLKESGESLLDLDPVFLSLGIDNIARMVKYNDFLSEKIQPGELKLIRESVNREQLTGNSKFEDEVERIIGLRIIHRSQGRPLKKDYDQSRN